ncbi:hypothetical protein L2X99_13655 [Microbacterium sp. KUDC0406]|uniref:hypothetical protein n=1 Tax=Microbacterium sp. KUDC0406 TaxID=2909588 RepID=UPI001F160FE9|nr:hypothetical protein [Microbacterium sp. KUDC0406]UJP09461.1 hypothetical protein L2X99_13655 [Microbacterium sp. KUDC0406]
MYRSSYEAPAEVPSDDAVVLPDALNLPARDATAPPHDAAVPPAPVELAGTVPPLPSAVVPAALPTAPPIARVRVRRGFPVRALAIGAGAAVVAGVILTTIALVSGGGEQAPVARERTSITVPSTSGLPGERGGPAVRRTAPPSSAPAATVPPVSAPVVSAPPQDDDSSADRAERDESAPQPRPSAPPASSPSEPTPRPSPAAPAAPAPLAFTDIAENPGKNLLGMEIVDSYTLSMTGQPGSTAGVTYGWKDAGSVTFDAAGRGAIDIGRSVLDLIPGNARVRAEYSDGTEGDPIEMRRKDIGG